MYNDEFDRYQYDEEYAEQMDEQIRAEQEEQRLTDITDSLYAASDALTQLEQHLFDAGKDLHKAVKQLDPEDEQEYHPTKAYEAIHAIQDMVADIQRGISAKLVHIHSNFKRDIENPFYEDRALESLKKSL